MQELHGRPRIRRAAALLVLSSLWLGCAPREMGPAEAVESAPQPPTTVDLDVPDFRPAVLVVPGRPGPHPVLVVAHGAGDRGEWQCEWWTPVLGERAFILCPRGRKVSYLAGADDSSYFVDHHKLGREVTAALGALRERYGSDVDPGPVAFAGFSQGGIMGALYAQKRGDVFARLALIEGGYEEWNLPIARRFKQTGGERVLLACGIRYCARGAERSRGWLEQAGVAARVEHAPGAGHTYAGEVGNRIIAALPWLFEGDSRW
jgi:predicted esterase